MTGYPPPPPPQTHPPPPPPPGVPQVEHQQYPQQMPLQYTPTPPADQQIPPQMPPTGPPSPTQSREKSKKRLPKIGGVMFILGAIFALASLGVGALVIISGINEKLSTYAQFAIFVAPIFAMLYGVIGGIFAIKIKKLMVIIVSGIFGMIFALMAGLLKIGDVIIPQPISLIAVCQFLVGVVLVAIGRKEFMNVK